MLVVLDRDERFLLLNRRFEELFGVDAERAMGHTPSEVLPAEVALVFEAAAHAALRGEPAVERDLDPLVPAGQRGVLSLRLILHGRRVCVARKPRCPDCVLNDFCPSAFRV